MVCRSLAFPYRGSGRLNIRYQHDSSHSLLQGLRKSVSFRSYTCDRYEVLPCRFYLVFISEITARAFIIADSNKRRTLSRSDITKALSKSDQFDFLIDIVPRDEVGFAGTSKKGSAVAGPSGTQGKGEQVRQYYAALELKH
jgi:hypothetical protein